MRRFVSFVVELLVCSACMALEPQEISVGTFSMRFETQTEQIHWLFVWSR